MEGTKEISVLTDIERFKVEMNRSRVPLVLRDYDIGTCIHSWKDPSYLIKKVEDRTVKIHVSTHLKMDFRSKNFKYKDLGLHELIRRASRQSELENYFLHPEECYYLRDIGTNVRDHKTVFFNQDFPELSSDLRLPDVFPQDRLFSSVFRISSPGIQVWTHYDVMDNIYLQIVGRKRAVFWAPSSALDLYLDGDKSKVIDIDSPDEDLFPDFLKAPRWEANLIPGDVLFIPSLWFHNMKAEDFGVAVNAFWKNLDESLYDKKDVYGNKDLLPAAKANRMLDNVMKQLDQLDDHYKDFYARQLMNRIRQKYLCHFSLVCGLSVFISFFGVIGFLILALKAGNGETEFPNFFSKWIPPHWHNGFPCPNCGNRNCVQHIPSSEPWTNLLIPVEIDSALEKAVDRILDVYIYQWYNIISVDDQVVQEIRLLIRDVASNLARRLAQVNLTELITKDVISCSLKHLDCILRIDTYENPSSIRLAFFEKYKPHPALNCRESEVKYLLNLSSLIAPYLISSKHLRSKSLRYLIEELLSGAVLQPIADIIPNPDIVNYLIFLLFDQESIKKFPEPSGEKTELLSNFVNSHNQTYHSALHMDLSAILKDQATLFAFMKFLREEKCVSDLQFCLSVEDFNKRIMNPDLTTEEISLLHSEAQNLFDQYLVDSSPYKVNVSPNLIEEIQKVLQGPIEDVIRLRTTTPLFKAYEEVYTHLETILCPRFHKSEEYYMHLLGRRTDEIDQVGDKTLNRRWKDWLKFPFKKQSSKYAKASVFYANLNEHQSLSQIDLTRVTALATLNNNYNDVGNDDGHRNYFRETLSTSKSVENLRKLSSPNNPRIKSKSLPRSTLLDYSKDSENASNSNNTSSKMSAFFKPVKFLTLPIHNFLQQQVRSQPSESNNANNKILDKSGKSLSYKIKRGVLDQDLTAQAFDLADIYMDDKNDYVNGMPEVDVHEFRDLSAWRVTIPRLTTAASTGSFGKVHFVFVIDIQRIDVESKERNGEDLHWSVQRRFSEFYALESKLTEFHGEFEDTKLPAKSKFFNGKGLDSMQAKQQPFEDYLIKLLQKPSLKESDLLYTFLTSSEEFTVAASKLGLSKMIKNVKLTKERGQALQPFINGFVASTQSPPPKPRLDWVLSEHDYDAERRVKFHPLYGNNVGSWTEREMEHEEIKVSETEIVPISGVTDTILYLADRLFRIRDWKMQILLGVRLFLKSSLDHLINYGLAVKLKHILSPGRIAHLIKLVEESIFEKEGGSSRTDTDKLKRRNLAEKRFKAYLSPYLKTIVGKDAYEEGTSRIFLALQDPILNKQLVYQLLDIAISRLFPEIKDGT